jgi:hypothetical protein
VTRANGIEWALFDAGVGHDSVLIQGPTAGLSQAVACKQSFRSSS